VSAGAYASGVSVRENAPVPGPGEAREPWYVQAFRGDYRLVYAHRDLESAEREVAWLVAQGLAGRVLDLCCGFGRHALAMARAGLAVAGVDLSPELLRAARELPGFERHLRGRLVRGDAQRLPLAAASFDAATLLFSSFGYFGEQGDRQVLAELARVLRPGGLAVLDLMNPAQVRAALVPRSRRSGPGFVLAEARQLADGGRRVIKDVELEIVDERGQRELRRWREDVRMYEVGELRELLVAHGLALERVAGDFGALPSGPAAPRAIAFARKPA
jgi:SAM-dependent methyltransferase